MRKLNDKFVQFDGEDGSHLDIYTDNMGEPYRSGVSLALKDSRSRVAVFLEQTEARKLRDTLSEILGDSR